jgi:hypothetical protein
MKRLSTPFLLTILMFALGCKTKYEPRPLADTKLLAGKWERLTRTGTPDGYQMEIDPVAQTGTYIKVPSNFTGIKVGDLTWRNIIPVDASSFRAEMKYRTTIGFYYYADGKITIQADTLTYSTYSGSNSTGSVGLSVSNQIGKFRRIK